MLQVQKRRNSEYNPKSLGTDYASPEAFAKRHQVHADVESLKEALTNLREDQLQYVLALMWSGRDVLGQEKHDTFEGYIEAAKGERGDGSIQYITGMNPIADNFMAGIKANTNC
jgi:hypothetical protein